jgi:hypothetical protein
MAEHVTQFDRTKGRRADLRFEAMLDRFGGHQREVRGREPRDAEAMFEWLKAAKGRYPVARVRRHICHHDEGIGLCTVAQEA